VLRPLVALVGLAIAAGCGADELKARRGPPPCPAGTPELGVKDVLPTPPPGTEIVPSDPKGAKPIKDALRQEAGDKMRSIYSRVVTKRGRVNGTGVYVSNLDEHVDPRDVIAGAGEAADDIDVEPEPLTIAGEDAVLVAGPGGVVASGKVGDCSVVTLMSQNEAEVRAVAEKIRPPG
jgi:hypothetical protein